MFSRILALLILPAFALLGDDTGPQPTPSAETIAPTAPASTPATTAPAPTVAAPAAVTLQERSAASAENTYPVAMGTKILLAMVNTVSTKSAQAGDRIYLETSFPIFINNRMVIPQGSYVMGTVTNSVRPGKVKGKGEFYLRFDSLTLPNGVTRDFHAALSNMDGGAAGTVDRAESGVKSDGNVGGDMKTIGIGAGVGAGVGGIASVGRPPLTGMGIGAGAGAVAGLVTVLFTRGPDAVLTKGTNVEMVLDRELLFHDEELNFSKSAPQVPGAPPQQTRPVLGRP